MTLKVTAIGNLTRDAELRTLNSGETVLNFSLARNDRRTQQVTYLECSVWGKLGQAIAPWATKGTKCYVDGDLSTRTWEGNNGTMTNLTCRVRDIELLGGKPDQSGNRQEDNNDRPSNGMDDEIPF